VFTILFEMQTKQEEEDFHQYVTDLILASIANDTDRYYFMCLSDARNEFHMSNRIAALLDGKLVYCEKKWLLLGATENRRIVSVITEAYRKYIDYSYLKTCDLLSTMTHERVRAQLKFMIEEYEKLMNCSLAFINLIKCFLKTSLEDNNFLSARKVNKCPRHQPPKKRRLSLGICK